MNEVEKIKIILNEPHKSIKEKINFELPKFSVIVGKNGSGKSHLLEAIENKAIVNNEKNISIKRELKKYIPFGGLIPNNLSGIVQSSEINQKLNQLFQQYNNVKIQYNNSMEKRFTNLSPIERFKNLLGAIPNGNLIIKVIEKNKENFDKLKLNDFYEIKIEDFQEYNFMTVRMGEVFKDYFLKWEKNKYYTYRNVENNEKNKILSEMEFKNEYGVPPWEIMNQILDKAKIKYNVNNPQNDDRDASFEIKLIDKNNTEDEIRASDLSTGEKVLMSLGLAIYTANNNKIELLMLDEPDAALHPEYSKYMINILKKEIVEKAKIKVIMTTHSPITVAACDEDDIYEMDVVTKIPKKISKNEAVKILSAGFEPLKISVDKRRQVFVESMYDVENYEGMYNIIKQSNEFQYEPTFLPPHGRDGSNCEDVKNIVKKLVELGNDLVYGIIDWDKVNIENKNIVVLGNGKRYAIENYIFDPLALFAMLVREGIKEFKRENGEIIKFIEVGKLEEHEYQNFCNEIVKELDLESQEKIECLYLNEKKILISKLFLEEQGHALETKIINKWTKLNGIKKNRENELKKHIINAIYKEYPEFISRDIYDVFSKIGND